MRIFKSVAVLTRTSKVERETLRAKDFNGCVSGDSGSTIDSESPLTFGSSGGANPALASMRLRCCVCAKPLNVSDETLKANLSLKVDKYILFFLLREKSEGGSFFSSAEVSRIIYGVFEQDMRSSTQTKKKKVADVLTECCKDVL